MKAFLDTHICVLLFESRAKELGRRSRDLVARSALFVSPIVGLELAFLQESGKVSPAPAEILGANEKDLGVVVSPDPMLDVIRHAMDLNWTRDPLDRLLVATARLHKAPLITKDQALLQHFPDAVWSRWAR